MLSRIIETRKKFLKSKKKLSKDLTEISTCDDLKKLHLKYGNIEEAESGKFKIFDLKSLILNLRLRLKSLLL